MQASGIRRRRVGWHGRHGRHGRRHAYGRHGWRASRCAWHRQRVRRLAARFDYDCDFDRDGADGLAVHRGCMAVRVAHFEMLCAIGEAARDRAQEHHKKGEDLVERHLGFTFGYRHRACAAEGFACDLEALARMINVQGDGAADDGKVPFVGRRVRRPTQRRTTRAPDSSLTLEFLSADMMYCARLA